MPRKNPLIPKPKLEPSHISQDGSILMTPLSHNQFPSHLTQTQPNQGFYQQQVNHQQFMQHPAYHPQPYSNASPILNQIPNSAPNQNSYLPMGPSLLHCKSIIYLYFYYNTIYDKNPILLPEISH